MTLMLAAWRDMFTDFMDFDPRITSDGDGWHCNFHLGHGQDVILEDAINEKSCVQALQCLTAKADAEIHELEDELAILQCQQKWAESDKHGTLYEVCCATFEQKIDYLTEALQKLKSKGISNQHDMDTTLEIPRPAERICDIINSLTKQNFSAHEKQVEDLSKELDLLINSGSVDIATDLKQKESTLESPAESRELTTDFERPCKPVDTVSEESCLDVARTAIKDSFEDRVLGKIDVEETQYVEVGACERTPEERNQFTTCVQAYNEGNSKSNALRHEETEDCFTRSKNSGSGSSPSSKTNIVAKVEVDDSDISNQNVAADFQCMTQDQESRSLFDVKEEVKENQSPITHDVEITYSKGRKRSSLSAIIKPPGRKVQKKIFNSPKQSNHRMLLKPQGKTSNGKNLGQQNSPSQEANMTLPEITSQRKSIDTTLSLRSTSEEDDLYARENLASKSHNELVVYRKSPRKTSLRHSSSVSTRNVSAKSTNLDIVATKDSQAYDLESLRLKFTQQPEFLQQMKIPELKLIAKVNNIRGISKLKKEIMIDELTKLLNTA